MTNQDRIKLIIATTMIMLAGTSLASNNSNNKSCTGGAAIGEHFYCDTKKESPKPFEEIPKEKPMKPTEEVAKPQPPKPETKKQDCSKKEEWTASCGFVDPKNDFSFQEKQRDALMERMVMTNNNPKDVEAFQYYIKWILEKSIAVGNMWQYNAIQNADLNANLRMPSSAFGINLMKQAKSDEATDAFSDIKESKAEFFFFSKSTCSSCHAMKDVYLMVQKKTGIPITNVPVDGVCISGFNCLKSKNAIKVAAKLKSTVVPSLYLVIPPDTSIAVAAGIDDASSIIARLANFYTMYRSAMLKGLSGSGGSAPMDFSYQGKSLGQSINQPKNSPTDDQLNSLIDMKGVR